MDKIPLETCGKESVVRFRDCFSVRYIQSAALLCQLAFKIEQESRHISEVPAEILLRHEAFALNSVLSSVAFLESTINELYADAADEVSFSFDGKDDELLHHIHEAWTNEKNFDRAPLVTRYQKILTIADKPVFLEGDRAYDNVCDLISIRNHLMHYRREWVEVRVPGQPTGREVSAARRFENELKKKFAPNPFAHKNLPFFPDHCLGHGCAEWAVINSLIFCDEFFRRLDLPAPYEGVRDEMATR